MPTKTVHCSICRKAISGEDFKERMAKLRRHRKKEHPKAFMESYERIRSKVKHPEVKYTYRGERTKPFVPVYASGKTVTHDPKVIKVRRKLISRPGVLAFKDYKGSGLVRLLHREDDRLFPEIAVYLKFRGLKHKTQDDMLKAAGLLEEERGKWVLRTDKFSIFLYV